MGSEAAPVVLIVQESAGSPRFGRSGPGPGSTRVDVVEASVLLERKVRYLSMRNAVIRDLSRTIRDRATGINLPKILVTLDYDIGPGGCKTLSKKARWVRPM